MLTAFQWFCAFAILAATFAGGFYPLLRRDLARSNLGFPLGEAFTAGVFLALALTMMLPSSSHLLGKVFPQADYPVASAIAIVSFLLLLACEQISQQMEEDAEASEGRLAPPAIPLMMTALIAVPSFFLGAALGVSATETAIFIFIAIIMHKSSAAFALALKMVRSTLTKGQTWLTFSCFAAATPLGIVVGRDIHELASAQTLTLIKGVILGLAAGTFLYMATLHELRHAPMIRSCCHVKGFALLLAGFVITALVRYLIGEAHRLS